MAPNLTLHQIKIKIKIVLIMHMFCQIIKNKLSLMSIITYFKNLLFIIKMRLCTILFTTFFMALFLILKVSNQFINLNIKYHQFN